MIHALKSSLLYVLLAALVVFSACNPDVPGDEECNFDTNRWCGGSYSFSIVNQDTYENLAGAGRLIDPNKVLVTNTKTDTMNSNAFEYSDGWYIINRFNPFQEIYCFDMCLSDSAFTRTYYLNYGGEDIDTMQIHFPERDDTPIVTFNNTSTNVPNDIADSLGIGRSLYWFRKKIN